MISSLFRAAPLLFLPALLSARISQKGLQADGRAARDSAVDISHVSDLSDQGREGGGDRDRGLPDTSPPDQAPADQPVADQATANKPPVVDSSYQSVKVAGAGDAVTLRVVAHDPEGGALTITWTASAGTLGTPSTTSSSGSYTSEVVWTAPSLEMSTSFTVIATIKDPASNTTVQTFTLTAKCAWTVVNTGHSYPSNLGGIWGTNSSDLYVTGDFGLILHYNGSTWTRQTLQSYKSRHIRDIWGAGGKIVATGNGSPGVVFEYQGNNSWKAVHTDTEELNAVHGWSSTGWAAFGDNGHVVYNTGSGWQNWVPKGGFHYRNVWATSGSQVYASGFYHVDVFDFTQSPPAITRTYNSTSPELIGGLFGVDGMLYVGTGSGIWSGSLSGSTLTASYPTGATSIADIWGLSSTDLYLGTHGGASRYDGTTVTQVMSSSATPTNKVFGFGATDIWAVTGHNSTPPAKIFRYQCQ